MTTMMGSFNKKDSYFVASSLLVEITESSFTHRNNRKNFLPKNIFTKIFQILKYRNLFVNCFTLVLKTRAVFLLRKLTCCLRFC